MPIIRKEKTATKGSSRSTAMTILPISHYLIACMGRNKSFQTMQFLNTNHIKIENQPGHEQKSCVAASCQIGLCACRVGHTHFWEIHDFWIRGKHVFSSWASCELYHMSHSLFCSCQMPASLNGVSPAISLLNNKQTTDKTTATKTHC